MSCVGKTKHGRRQWKGRVMQAASMDGTNQSRRTRSYEHDAVENQGDWATRQSPSLVDLDDQVWHNILLFLRPLPDWNALALTGSRHAYDAMESICERKLQAIGKLADEGFALRIPPPIALEPLSLTPGQAYTSLFTPVGASNHSRNPSRPKP